MRSQTDGSPWTMRRATRGGGTDLRVVAVCMSTSTARSQTTQEVAP